MDSNKEEAKQLGMPFGTANGKLRKMILFSMVQRHNEDICYRCGRQIGHIKDFSIEHKKPWLNKNTSLFWDLGNIAFSHIACNVGAAKRRERKHGSHSYYADGCRCGKCREAHCQDMRRWRELK